MPLIETLAKPLSALQPGQGPDTPSLPSFYSFAYVSHMLLKKRRRSQSGRRRPSHSTLLTKNGEGVREKEDGIIHRKIFQLFFFLSCSPSPPSSGCHPCQMLREKEDGEGEEKEETSLFSFFSCPSLPRGRTGEDGENVTTQKKGSQVRDLTRRNNATTSIRRTKKATRHLLLACNALAHAMRWVFVSLFFSCMCCTASGGGMECAPPELVSLLRSFVRWLWANSSSSFWIHPPGEGRRGRRRREA